MTDQLVTGSALEEFLKSKGYLTGAPDPIIPEVESKFEKPPSVLERGRKPTSTLPPEEAFKGAPYYSKKTVVRYVSQEEYDRIMAEREKEQSVTAPRVLQGERLIKFLQNKGYELNAWKQKPEVIKPLPVTDPRAPTREQVAAGIPLLTPGPEIPTPEVRPQEILDRPADYVPPPSKWQEIKDIAFLLRSGDLDAYAIVARGLLKGPTGGLIDPIKLVEKISGQKGFTEEYNREVDRQLQEKVGYTPKIAAKVASEAGEFVGYLIPFSRILKGAGKVAKTATKIPILQAVARAELTGIGVGLTQTPEDDGILQRLKQVPASVAFFTVMDVGLLSAQQVLRIVRYNRAAKFYKNVNWDAIPDPPGTEPYTAKQMRDLFIKFRGNGMSAAGPKINLTSEEERILEFFKAEGGWKEAAKKGWMAPEGFDPAKPLAEIGDLTGKLRKPRFADIFRDPELLPLYEPGFEPPGIRRPRAGVPPTEPPPVRPEAPPVRPTVGVRPEAAPPTERPVGVRREGVPAVVVDVTPKPEGGWTYNFKIPTAEPVAPAAVPVIDWKPTAALPEAKIPPPRVGKKAKVFSNPLFQFLNLAGGVKPTPDYNYQALKQVLPFDLIRKDGEALDVLAQAATVEFPNIENDADLMNALENIADTKAAIKFRNVTTGEELEVPQEFFDEQLDSFILDEIEAGRGADLSPAEAERARELVELIPPEEAEGYGLDEGIARVKQINREQRAAAEKGFPKEPPVKPEEEAIRKIVEKDVAAAPRIPEEEIAKPPEKIPREKKIEPEKPIEPAPVVKEAELIKALDDLEIPAEHRGEVSVSVLKNFDPEKGDLENYIRKTIANISKRKGPEKAARLKEQKKIKEEEISKEAPPSARLAEAQAEVDILEAIERATKNKKEVEIMRRRILDEDSFEEIGKTMKISRQRAQKVFADTIVKMKKDPEVIRMLENRYKEVHAGPKPKWEDITKIANTYFTSSKGMSKQIDAANDKRVQNPIADLFLTTLEGREVSRWIKKYDNAGLRQQVKELLTGEMSFDSIALPENVPEEALKSLRKRIDDLSTLIMAHGGLKEPTLAAFESGIGKYLGTFYRLHEYNELNKGRLIKQYWDPPQEARDNFAAALRRDDPAGFADFTDEMMDNFLDSMLRGEDYVYKGSNRTKRVPTEHYKSQVGVSKEYEDFAGIITDPVWLSLRTVTKQTVMGNNAQFLNTMEDNPEIAKMVTHDLKTARSRGWQGNQLPDDYSYGRLRGAWVHPELNKFIRGEINPQMSSTERMIMKFVMNPFKATKTIWSVPTHARNITGGVMFSFLMQTSIFNPLNAPYYWDTLRIWHGRKGKFRNEWAEFIRRGVTETQFFKSEIPDLYNELLRLDPPDWPEKIFSWAVRKPANALGELYNFEDVLYRGAAYLKQIKHFKKTPQEAVDLVNLSSPNYRKVPIAVEWLRRYPALGPFISFRFNVARILSNNALLAGKEISSKDPKKKIEGWLRLYRLAFIIGFPLLLAKISAKVFDVDEKKVKALEKTYPSYKRGGTIVYFRGKEGQLKGYDFTYTYPTGDIIKAINNLINGETDSFSEDIQLFAHPIFDAYSIIVKGEDPYWKAPIKDPLVRRATELVKLLWLPQSAPIPSIQGLVEGIKTGKIGENLRVGKLTTYQIESMIQAYQKQEDRYGRVRKLPEEIKNFFTGVRTWDINPQVLIAQYIKQKQFALEDAERAYKGWLRRNTRAASWQIEEEEALLERKRDKIFNDIERVGKLLESMDPTFHLRKTGRFK